MEEGIKMMNLEQLIYLSMGCALSFLIIYFIFIDKFYVITIAGSIIFSIWFLKTFMFKQPTK